MNVSYTTDGGELLTENNVASGLVYAFNTPGDQRIVYLVVKSVDESLVAASIFIDGHEAASGTSDTGLITLSTQLP